MNRKFKRSEGLSTFAAIAFAVGMMVGAGIFVLSGMVINVTGPSAVISYLICGILVTFSGLSYATLSSVFPENGGGYLYAKRMLGNYPGFLAGWAMYVSMMIATSFVLIGLGIYLNMLLGTNFDPRLGAIVAIILLTALNLRGLSDVGKIEVVLVVTKVTILAIFIVIGLVHVQSTIFEPFLTQGTGGLLEGVTMIFFAYMGFQVISMMAGEIKESSRRVPIAMLASIVIVAILYIGVIVALLSAQLPSYGSKSVFDAAIVLLGTYGGFLVALAAVISTLSSANANIIGASRVITEMASEKQIPGRFAMLKNNQPINSILIGSSFTTILIVYGNLDFIVDLTNVAMLSTMVLVNISALMLIKREKQIPPEKSYFKIPLGPLFPILGVASCFLMLISLPPSTIALGIVVILFGSFLYVLNDTTDGKRDIDEIKKLLIRKG